MNVRECKFCGGDTIIPGNDYRSNKKSDYFKRYRKCVDCGVTVSTYEISEEDFEILKKIKKGEV